MFLENVSSKRGDEVGLFANMMLYECYFKAGVQDLCDEKFKIVE
ncbi:MAG: hypothetical protein RMJ81_05465 [Candidatus Kryptonium sp.]|nr:hypothetical protein [Candidatus Kryptonium sp.]